MTTGLREAMQSVLDLQKHWTAHTTPEMQERGALIRNRIPILLEPTAEARQFKVQASAGAGSNNRVPWVRVFRPDMSPSPQEGWYAVFLFAADGSALFLSLNQGTTDWSSGRGKPKDQGAVAARSGHARIILTQSGLNLEGLSSNIQLGDPDLGKTYEHGNVFAFAYGSTAIPADDTIISDLSRILELLEVLHAQWSEPADVSAATESIGSPSLSNATNGEGAEVRTWIFQANPLLYNIAEAVDSLPSMSWLVNRYKDQIKIGDRVYLWRSGKDSGIVAAATVMSEPGLSTINDEELSYAVEPEKFRGVQTRVWLRIDEVLHPMLSKNDLKSDQRLAGLSILNFSQGTNFQVTDAEADAIDELIAGQNQELGEVEEQQAPRIGEETASARTWVYAPGKGAEYWEEFYRDGIMAIGWDELGDLGQYAGLDSLTAAITETYKLEGRPVNDSRACFDFVHGIRPGDRVIAKKGRSVIVGYGVVTGEYQHLAERAYYRNVRAVRWDGRGSWTAEGLVLPLKALTDFTRYRETVSQIDSILGLDQDQPPAPRPAILPPYTVENALQGVVFERKEIETILRIWENKNNLILQGPPGVGKTFLARRLAYALIGYELPSRVGMVQFHQSYAYEDFIQGYRPTPSGGFKRRDGIFVRFCNKAKIDQESRYVFIIDEINRGNVSKIFGELLMLIEKDYRGSQHSVALTYSSQDDEQFYVPKNVFLLGMMNTADRSLALVDYALRRRFSFERLTPLFGQPAFLEFLENAGTDPLLARTLSKRLMELNEEITGDANLGKGFCVGHSYFCRQGGLSEDGYFDVIRNEILPLLEEYWVDDRDRVDKWQDQLLASI